MATAKKRQGLTQRDIAQLARVSQATVSRVLTGDDSVDLLTAERVQQVIRQHNYRPDIAARALRNRRSGLIGLVIKRPAGGLHDDPFFANLISAIIDYLSGTPYHLCLELTTETQQVAVYDDLLRTRRVDGLILVESEAKDERIKLLHADRFPFVLIGNPDNDRIWSVDNDNVLAAERATRHLLEMGYRRVALLGGPRGVTVAEDRAAGYCSAMASEGLPVRIWRSNFGLDGARQTALGALADPDRPDAMVVLDDFMAMGVVLAARELGLRVPVDLGLVGFNDSSLCDVVDCGLTSVNLNIPDIVREACGRLLQLIENDGESASIRRTIVPTHLAVRGSSKPSGHAVVAL